MNCNSFSNNILHYLDHELSKEEALSFESHLERCSRCLKIYEQISLTYQVIVHENKIRPNPFFYTRLKAKLDNQKEVNVISIFTSILKPIALAASITLGIIIGNGELELLNSIEVEDEAISENFTPALPTDFTVWISMNEDNGNEN